MFPEVILDIRIHCYLFFTKFFFSGNREKKGEMMATDFVWSAYLLIPVFIHLFLWIQLAFSKR